MKKDFAPHAEALELKALEFDEPCFGYYIETGKWIPASYSKEGMVYPSNSDLFPEWVASPTYSQAFRWFREKYNLIGLVEGGYDNGKNVFTYVIWDDFKDNSYNDYYINYKDAELACLIKLIEIVKQNDRDRRVE